MSDQTKWTLIATGATVLAAIAVRKAAARGWATLGRTPPPEDPELERTGAGEAFVWSVLSSSAVGLARLGARRLMARAWRTAGKGSPPA